MLRERFEGRGFRNHGGKVNRGLKPIDSMDEEWLRGTKPPVDGERLVAELRQIGRLNQSSPRPQRVRGPRQW